MRRARRDVARTPSVALSTPMRAQTCARVMPSATCLLLRLVFPRRRTCLVEHHHYRRHRRHFAICSLLRHARRHAQTVICRRAMPRRDITRFMPLTLHAALRTLLRRRYVTRDKTLCLSHAHYYVCRTFCRRHHAPTATPRHALCRFIIVYCLFVTCHIRHVIIRHSPPRHHFTIIITLIYDAAARHELRATSHHLRAICHTTPGEPLDTNTPCHSY